MSYFLYSFFHIPLIFTLVTIVNYCHKLLELQKMSIGKTLAKLLVYLILGGILCSLYGYFYIGIFPVSFVFSLMLFILFFALYLTQFKNFLKVSSKYNLTGDVYNKAQKDKTHLYTNCIFLSLGLFGSLLSVFAQDFLGNIGYFMSLIYLILNSVTLQVYLSHLKKLVLYGKPLTEEELQQKINLYETTTDLGEIDNNKLEERKTSKLKRRLGGK